jgi:penicillin-binding protein 2
MTESKTKSRMKLLAGLVAFMFAALTTRLWFLQVLASTEFGQQADQNQVRLVPIQPVRGLILDRHGRLLVGNRSSTVVTIDRLAMRGQDEQVLFRLSNLLHVPVKDLVDRMTSVRYLPYQAVPVAEDVSKEAVFYIREHQRQFPGVGYELDAVREYTQGSLAAHLLGYTGEISDRQLKDRAFHGDRAGDIVGKAGVEASYERALHGRPGIREIQVNAQGKVLDDNFNDGRNPPVPGDNLILSIDASVQRIAEQSLKLGIDLARHTTDNAGNAYKATGGSVIVMDPNNGQVLALSSYPTYDPAVFDNGLTDAEAASLGLPSHGVQPPAGGEVANNPLLDRALLGVYPPGSTFKPFVAAASMRERFATRNGRYPCPAQYTVPGDTSGLVFHNWSPLNYGFLTLPEALTVSCDTVFYQFGWDYWVRYYRSGRANEMMQRDLRAMGFGRDTAIDLPAELAGRVPDAAYKRDLYASAPKVFGPYHGWFPGDYINMSIGQGFMLVTPMQMAVAYSALANGGTLYAPRVAWKLRPPNGGRDRVVPPKVIGHLPIPRKTVTFLRDALTGVVTRGTAATAFAGFPLNQYPVAGKTGTADIAGRQPTSWFAAMAPAAHPKYVVVALVEQGGHGATTAAPIVRRILERLFNLGGHQPLQSGGSGD